jgi:hypothetical protein
MRTKVRVSIASILGAFFIYCTGDTLNHYVDGADSGPVSDAHAEEGDECGCTVCPAEVPTVIVDGETPTSVNAGVDGGCVTTTWDVSEYRKVVVQLDNPGADLDPIVQQKHGAGAGFVQTVVDWRAPLSAPMRSRVFDPIHGTLLRLRYSSSGGCAERKLTIVGYRQ